MKLRDFRIGWRLLVKEPAYSAVVIMGLAVGFAVCFLLLGYVRHSLSYDREVPERDRVYRLMQHWNLFSSDLRWNDAASLPARDAALASGQPILASTVIDGAVDVRAGDTVQKIGFAVVDPDFEKIFRPTVLAGDLRDTLSRPDALALTRETAIKLFGRADVVGQAIVFDERTFRIGAVLADQPAATTLPFDSLAGTSTAAWSEEYRHIVTRNWGSAHGRVYIKLLPGADPRALLEAVQRALRASPRYQRQAPDQLARLAGRNLIDFRLGALADAYLDPDTQDARTRHGDRNTIYGLAAVAALILLLAATNYVNLATVRTLRRQREIAVRKVLGAAAPAVVRQVLAESVLVCLIATGIGLLLAWLLLPVFSDLVQRKFDHMFDPAALAASLALGLLLGLAAGAYPSWSALRVLPTTALAGRGNAETTSGWWLRRTLTVLQLAAAMGLTGITLAVAWQTHYASTLNPGFAPEPLLTFGTNKDMRDARVHAFRDALARLPGVIDVGESDAPVTASVNSTSLRRDGGESIEINYYLVSPEFFDAYGLKPVAGRLYNPTLDTMHSIGRVVINQSAVKKFGFASAQDAIGKTVASPSGREKPMQIVGVAPDIRHRSAREPMQASVFYLGDKLYEFTVRCQDPIAVRREIERLWPSFFPNDVLEVTRMDTQIAERYADDRRLARLLAASSIIAIAIAAFGVYVLAAYSVQRRTREIVLRKLYGASGGAIGSLVLQEFAQLTCAGALLGLPAAWIATERYLSPFTERAPVGIWTVLAALAVAAAVALGATLRHTLAAMRITPILALRD